jgi:hypothetical protein
MQNKDSKRPRWPILSKIGMGVGLITIIAGGLIPYWASPTKDDLHTVQIRGRGFTAFLTPDQHFWCEHLSTYGFSIMLITAIVSVVYVYVRYRRR